MRGSVHGLERPTPEARPNRCGQYVVDAVLNVLFLGEEGLVHVLPVAPHGAKPSFRARRSHGDDQTQTATS